MATEVERRWLVDGEVPWGRATAATDYRQGYLTPDGSVAEVRVRAAGDARRLTVKAGAGLSRTEVELDLDPDDFDALWPTTAGARVEKVRHLLPLDGGTAEVDVFGGALDGLVLVEVEFPTEDAARAFVPPPWFGREVTEVGGWTNASLARHGRPADD